MASIYDVMKGLVDVFAEQLVPGATDYETTLTNSTVMVNGAPVPLRIFMGEPNPDELDREVADPPSATGCYITVRPEPGMMRVLPQVGRREWRMASKVPITVGAIANANVVTIAGEGTAGQVLGIGYRLNPGDSFETGWSHRCEGPETAQQIASAFASIIPGAIANGAQVTLDTAAPISVGVVSDRTMAAEIGRQSQMFRIDVWAPSPKVRDYVAGMIPVVANSIRALAFSDGTFSTTLTCAPVWRDDQTQKVGVWREWFRVDLAYPTTNVQVQPGVLHFAINNEGKISGRQNPDGEPV